MSPPKSPLLVHLLFHPASVSARSLARHVHSELNDDSVVPGLQVPTAFCPWRRGHLTGQLMLKDFTPATRPRVMTAR
jgi:hypothetical protein